MSAEKNRQIIEVVRDYLRKDPEQFLPSELKPHAKEVIEFMTETPERFAIIPVLAAATCAIDPSMAMAFAVTGRRMYREMQKQEDERIALETQPVQEAA